MLNITEVRVHLVQDSNTKLAAYASITLDDCFVVHGIKIIEGERGIFVGMPRRKRPGMASQDICHPLDVGTRRQIEERVTVEYQRTKYSLPPGAPIIRL